MKALWFPCVLALVAAFQGCARNLESPITQSLIEEANCPESQDRFWSALYREVDVTGELPSVDLIDREVRSLVKASSQSAALISAYASIARETRLLTRSEALIRLAEMEIGDRTTDEKRARQDEIELRLRRARETSIEVLGNCPTPAPSPSPVQGGVDPVPMFESWRNSEAPVVYGAHKTFSVAYQSCNALELPPLTASTPSIEGVTITGRHENGLGYQREVTDAAAVFRTNPFYSLRVSPQAGCLTSSETPLIYDYGGKPFSTTIGGGALDLFQNAGSGADSLGIDCSGFVTSAVLSGGLRLKRNVTSKAPQSGGVSASMFSDPAVNGLSCFARVVSTPVQDLFSGDIIANTGHVVLVDRVGSDPFGVKKAKTSEDCNAIRSTRFDFTIIQSSPSKNGMGLNRYQAADYFSSTVSMKAGLEAYAKSFCRVRLGLSPVATLASPSTAVILRHSGGAECSDVPIPLVGERCLQSCGQ